ncbi:hypothetical protein KQ306_08840 [Synechococcus sp. CS-1324]|uniref:hypothetical protein n=1 Tax=Synechococcus sp. CS-1324 TaxID=2847980 RepID=UPI000DB4BAD2|nr:hypothetical protein [Synechococcus sp. CS-1324]MCT0230954.1 hypothetical protein [Synechococcus sp. CS-1324]PZV04193.1 MAG: hypothetical protein DCF23_07145 [Cyanobium sp.]
MASDRLEGVVFLGEAQWQGDDLLPPLPPDGAITAVQAQPPLVSSELDGVVSLHLDLQLLDPLPP